MSDCKPVSTPHATSSSIDNKKETSVTPEAGIEIYHESITVLLYILTRTLRHISAYVAILIRKCKFPVKSDWIGIERIMRYLKGPCPLD